MKTLLLYLLFPALLFAQEFDFVQELDSISLVSDDLNIAAPWIGGYYFSSPESYDLDNDNDLELLVGGYFQLDYFINEGDSILPEYTYSENQLIDSTISCYYYTYPSVCDIDYDGDGDLFGLQTEGASVITFFENIGSSTQPEFIINQDTLRDENNEWIWGGNMDWVDIDADGDFDLFIGKDNDNDPTSPGDIYFWRNIGTPEVYNFVQENQMYLTFDAGGTVEVQLVDQENDGDGDLFFHTQNLGWMRNIGTNSNPSFNVMSMNIMGVGVCGFGLCDLDNDLDSDMIISLGWQVVTKYYENIGTALNPSFIYLETITTDTVASSTFADLDSDGDNDMLMVHYNWSGGNISKLWYYENQGTPEQFNFVLIDQNYAGIEYGPGIMIDLIDYDFDEDYDLLISDEPGSRIYYYKNYGSPNLADFIYAGEFNIEPYFSLNSGFYDIDNDQDIDIFAGQMSGGVVFFRNVTGETGVGPKRPLGPPVGKIDLGLAPNPGNPVTCISFTLPSPQEATMAVYNILGAKITTIAFGLQPPGEHSYYWNNSQVSSGVYIIRLETVEAQEVRKVVVVK